MPKKRARRRRIGLCFAFSEPHSEATIGFVSKTYWLVKQEPEDYSWENLVADKRAAWTGVRNFQARNNLRAMKRGDLVLFYHSGKEKQIVGLARVSQAAYPDPTAQEGDWVAVDLAPVQRLRQPVPLDAIRRQPKLSKMPLVTQSRLSVMPVKETEFAEVTRLAEGESA
jgi:predicted RNA-binding protein with PUA-like domain